MAAATLASSSTTPRASLVLFGIVVLVTSRASADLKLLGENFTFPSCAVKSMDPIFQKKPSGGTIFANIAIGEGIRDAARNEGLKARTEAEGDGKAIVYYYEKLIGDNGGDYRCDVDGTLTTPTLLTIVDKKITCPETMGPVDAGEKLPGVCSILKKGNDEIKIKWLHTDIVLNSNNTYEHGKAFSTLEETASPRFHGATLFCIMDTIAGVQSCNVTALVRYPPQAVSVVPAHQEKLKGKKATVKCEASDANPETIDITFLVKKKDDDDFKEAEADAVVGDTLTLEVDNDYDVQCQAGNGVGQVTRTAEIKVIEPARITGPLVQTPSPVEAGQRVNVTCSVQPEIATIIWTKKGEKVEGDGELLSLVVDRDDFRATVTCKAFVDRPAAGADFSQAVNESLVLDVVWAPVEEAFGQDSKDGVVTTTITFSGNPTPNLTLSIINGTVLEKSVTKLGDTRVLVKIVANETQLPIKYEVTAAGQAEPIKSGEVVTTPATTEAPPTVASPKSDGGTIAGIVVALILLCVCAALLVVMWKKNLLCPKKGSLDVEKGGTSASSDGGLSKPVELEDVGPTIDEPVEESQNKSSAPLLDDDDIKKPPVLENGQTEIIPTNSPSVSFDDQPPPAPATPPPPPPRVSPE